MTLPLAPRVFLGPHNSVVKKAERLILGLMGERAVDKKLLEPLSDDEFDCIQVCNRTSNFAPRKRNLELMTFAEGFHNAWSQFRVYPEPPETAAPHYIRAIRALVTTTQLALVGITHFPKVKNNLADWRRNEVSYWHLQWVFKNWQSIRELEPRFGEFSQWPSWTRWIVGSLEDCGFTRDIAETIYYAPSSLEAGHRLADLIPILNQRATVNGWENLIGDTSEQKSGTGPNQAAKRHEK